MNTVLDRIFCLSIYLSICLSICLSIYIYPHLSISIYLLAYLSNVYTSTLLKAAMDTPATKQAYAKTLQSSLGVENLEAPGNFRGICDDGTMTIMMIIIMMVRMAMTINSKMTVRIAMYMTMAIMNDHGVATTLKMHSKQTMTVFLLHPLVLVGLAWLFH